MNSLLDATTIGLNWSVAPQNLFSLIFSLLCRFDVSLLSPFSSDSVHVFLLIITLPFALLSLANCNPLFVLKQLAG